LTLPCFGQIDHLTISDGLPHNTIFCVLQDNDGYIWVGTQNGLAKYDGYTFDVYASKMKSFDKRGFKGRKISALYEDKKGNLWVGTEREGLNIKKASNDFFENLKEEISFTDIKDYEITSISEDNQANILIGTLGGGVLKYNLNTQQIKHFTSENSGLSDNRVFDVKMDNNERIWVATAGPGLNYLQEDGRFTISHEMVPNGNNMSGYRKKMLIEDDNIWLTVEGGGLYRINTQNLDYRRFYADSKENKLSSDAVLDVLRGDDGLIYIALDGNGLNIYDEEKDKISVYNRAGSNTLNSKALVCFLKDRTGDIWIGTYNGGLNIIKNQKIWFEFLRPGLIGETKAGYSSVLSIFQMQDSTIWVGTDGGGLNKLVSENGTYRFENFKHEPNKPNSISGNAVKTIFEDSQNRLLLGVFRGGLDIYDPKKNTIQHFDIGDNVIWSITEKDEKYWLGTLDKDIVILDPKTGKQEVLSSNESDANSLPQKDIMVIFKDSQNRIWAGTQRNGLKLWDEKDQHFIRFQHNPQDSLSLNDNEVRAIFQDSKDRLWIGTQGGGLNQWLGENRFSAITKMDGLIANNIMGITEDEEGMLWLTTFVGISRFNPETREIKNFNFHTKGNSNQFNQMAALCSVEGKLFFGGINGLNAIEPQKIKSQESKEQTEVIFTDLKIFNESVPVGKLESGRTILHEPIEKAKSIYLDYSDSSFSIDFAAMNFTNPEENEFLYKLEGFDSDWQSLNRGGHRVHYTNLDPGEFTFKVKFKEEIAQLTVFIRPPFWQTWWFRLLSIIVITSTIVGTIFFYTKRREESHKQQMLKAQSEILKLRNENLKTEVNAKNSKLMFSSAQMAHKNEILTNIKTELKTVEKETNISLRKLLNSIDIELMSEDYWKEFNNYVNQVDKNYSKKLMEKHPKLTQNDLRLCTLLRINMSTKEIAALLNISVRGVEQGRYRLKKRLELTNEDDLIKYISTFQ